MKIKKFYDFRVNEIFGFKKKEKPMVNRIDACVEDVIVFLKDNNINNWTEFTTSGRFDRFTINTIIDSNCDSKEELDEVRYRLRLKLSNVKQLKSMIQEYEEVEEYEKCSEIKKEISKKIR